MSQDKKTVLGWIPQQPQPSPGHEWDGATQQQTVPYSWQAQPAQGTQPPPIQAAQAAQQSYDHAQYAQQAYAQQAYAQQAYEQQQLAYAQQQQAYAAQSYPSQAAAYEPTALAPPVPYPPQPAAPQYAQQPAAPQYPPQPAAPQYPQQYPQYPQYPAQQGYYGHAPQPAVPSQAQHAQAPSNYLGQAAAMLQQKAEKQDKKKRAKSERPISAADATSGKSERLRFIRLTYLHLLGAILVFAGLSYLFLTNEFLIAKVSGPLFRFAVGGRWNWGVVLAAFVAVSWVADYWASHTSSRAMQYMGLGLYTIAEALIFIPLLVIVELKTASILARGGAEPHILRDSAFVTLGIFGALTASVFLTRKDFSFLKSGLAMASGAAMMLIVLSLVFGFSLGLVFSIAMVLLAAGYILFQTSQVLAHYDPRSYVAASLALFSSVALMFWYVIRIFMRARE